MDIRILLLLIFVIDLEAAISRRNELRHRPRQLLLPKSEENTWNDTDIRKIDKQKKMSQYERQDDKLTSDEQMEAAIDNSFIHQISNAVRQSYPDFSIVNSFEQTEIPNSLAGNDQSGPPDDQMLLSGCLAVRGQFPSLSNCANYLNCWDDIVIEQQCPSDLLFNEMTGLCDFRHNVNCGERPGPTPKPTLQPYIRRCPDLNGRYRSQTNCSEFYVCLAGSPIKFNCPRGLVYNDRVSVCDYPYNVDCQGAVSPMPILSYPVENVDNLHNSSNQYLSSSSSMNSENLSSVRPTLDDFYSDGSPFVETSRKPPQAMFRSGPYSQNAWNLRSLSELEQQQSTTGTTTILSDINHLLENGITREFMGLVQKKIPDTSVTDDQRAIVHTIPTEWTKLSCEDGKILRLDDTCSNVVVCKNHRPQLITCDSGFTYDSELEMCQNYTVAKCN